MKVLVTGANGFVGNSLCAHLTNSGHQVLRVVRRPRAAGELGIGPLGGATEWHGVLNPSIDVVVHLAAKVPEPGNQRGFNDEFNLVNVTGTKHLAQQCALVGIRRFVFMSTAKVLGEERSKPYSEADDPSPTGPYAVSKFLAEQELRYLATRTGMELVLLRPPLVYGPGVKGNLFRLIRAIDRGYPLPVGGVGNRRSLISLENLVSAIKTCIEAPEVGCAAYLVSDGEFIATHQLVHRIAHVLGRSPRLITVPAPVIHWMRKISGHQSAFERVFGSFAVEIDAIKDELGWMPDDTAEAEWRRTAEWYFQGATENAAFA